MKKNIFGILFLGLACSFFLPGSSSGADLKFVAEFEGGKLYKANAFNVLELNGSYHQMGRQYGQLLKKELHKFYEVAVNERFIKKEGLSYELIKNFVLPTFSIYPKRFREIFYGMAETSEMPLEKLLALEQVPGITFLTFHAGMSCSAIAAWGDYTSGGPLIFGRNFDLIEFFKEFSEFLNLVVYNPIDSIPTACICYAGQVTTFTGMNKAGLFIEDNEGVKSGGNIIRTNRLTLFCMELSFLFDYSSFFQLDAAFNTTRSNYAFIANVADKNAAYSYEWPTFGIKRRAGENNGLLVATNHFVDPSWGIAPPTPDASDRTVQRRKNLLALGEKYKGKFNPEKMMEVLDTPFDEGGATWPTKTAYQVIAIPEELKLWLKAPDFEDWTEIDLKGLFK